MSSAALTPEAFETLALVARLGSFAAAARELGKVPSALTYSMRQLEESLDVLLFDRRSRQAQLTPAGQELLREGTRVLADIDAIASRVKRVATGWEAQLTIAADGLISPSTLLDLTQAFDAQKAPTHLKFRNEVLSGTWEALLNGQADLALGLSQDHAGAAGVHMRLLGELPFVFVVAPHHPLAGYPEPLRDEDLQQHRSVAIADSARRLMPRTVGLLPGQEVLTVPSVAMKIQAQVRGLGCGFLPEPWAHPYMASGQLLVKKVARAQRVIQVYYAWRTASAGQKPGLALMWWLKQLERPRTRKALLHQIQFK